MALKTSQITELLIARTSAQQMTPGLGPQPGLAPSSVRLEVALFMIAEQLARQNDYLSEIADAVNSAGTPHNL